VPAVGARTPPFMQSDRRGVSGRVLTTYVLAALALPMLAAPGSAQASTPRKRANGAVVHHDSRSHLRRRPAARAAIVNGTPIAIAQAPWQVAVFAFFEGKGILCGGSIISPTEVLTAAHCVFGETTHVLAAEDFEVVAGTADLTQAGLESEPNVEERLVSTVRAHPYYNPSETLPAADDVAVLTLVTPLAEVPGAVEKIGLAAPGVGPEEGAPVNLTGFGAESVEPSELNGRLFAISMSTVFRRRCGGEADALFVCASSPGGSLCSGDSGGGLTQSGAPTTVVGVVDTVQVIEGVPCRHGADGGFANVAAPEIRDFVLGSEVPPRAPRGGSGIVLRGFLEVGSSLTCEPGAWSNAPSLTYAFLDNASGARLQSGAAQTYALSSADVGRAIVCEVQAANAGGTGVVRTEALGPIAAVRSRVPFLPEAGQGGGGVPQATTPGAAVPQIAAPVESATGEASRVSLGATRVAVGRDGTATVKLSCLGAGRCAGRVSLTARRTIKVKGRRAVLTVAISAAVAFSIVEGQGANVAIKLNAQGRLLLATAHGHMAGRLAIVQSQPAPVLHVSKSVALGRDRKA
jgi:hypothetical protein